MTPVSYTHLDVYKRQVFFSSGVFYYFLTEQVKALVQAMAEAFPGGVLVLDVYKRQSVMIALHDFFPQRFRHHLSLVFAVILFQRCFEADFLQLCMTIHEPRPAYCHYRFRCWYFVSRLDVYKRQG